MRDDIGNLLIDVTMVLCVLAIFIGWLING